MLIHLLLIAMCALGSSYHGGADKAKAEMSQADTEKLVKADLAKRLKLPEESLKVVEVSQRTWPDQLLGCRARRGVQEPTPVPGYLFVLEAAGMRHTYHADRQGHMARCDAPPKPLAPIMR